MISQRPLLLLTSVSFTAFSLSGYAQTVPPIEAGKQTLIRTGTAEGTGGLVASAHRRATEAGLEMLELGGNAFDATVAVAATLTVVEPMNSNIFGGYGTLIIYDSEQEEVLYLDNNGRFPVSANSDVFRQTDSRDVMHSARAVSTPGNLHGFEAMWQTHGSLPWATLWEPAAFHADEGVAVTAALARAITANWERFPDRARQIYGAGGEPFTEGDWLGQHELAASMRQVAEQGSEALYGGSIGEAIIEEIERGNGFLTMADLTAHQPEWFSPISINYREHQLITAGAPSNSFAALVTAGIMSRYNNTALGSNTIVYLHRLAEAAKHGFWTRLRYAGSPEKNPPPFEILLSEDYWQQQVDQLDPARASTFQPPGRTLQEGADTTHFVVADRWGNVVSATITLGQAFGSTVFVEESGIWLNNSMAFSTYQPKGNPMDAMPGTRKHSSKTPMLIMKDGRPWVAIGTPGGHTIPQTVAQLSINLIDFDMNLQTAVDTDRIAFAEPNVLLVEEGLQETVSNQLSSLGHQVRSTTQIGLVHALQIEYDNNGDPIRFIGAADRRGVGVALGLDVAVGR